MKKYLGVKIIEAEPMNLGDYNKLRGWTIPDNEDPARAGYRVLYPDNYISWSPKEIFEEAYRKTDGLTFGLAVEAMKKGYRVARAGWNGKGMWLRIVVPGGDNKSFDMGMENLPYIEMKTADNKLVPWLASQTDMLAEDWMIVE
jgi:hypothetical protein